MELVLLGRLFGECRNLFFGLSLILRKGHPFANDFSARLVVFHVRGSSAYLLWDSGARPRVTYGRDKSAPIFVIARFHDHWFSSVPPRLRPRPKIRRTAFNAPGEDTTARCAPSKPHGVPRCIIPTTLIWKTKRHGLGPAPAPPEGLEDQRGSAADAIAASRKEAGAKKSTSPR